MNTNTSFIESFLSPIYVMENYSLFIPRVFKNITKERVIETFEREIGKVEKIDMIERETFNLVYIHFEYWYDTRQVLDLQKRLLNKDNTYNEPVKIVYDDKWFWIVFINKMSAIRKNILPLAENEKVETNTQQRKTRININDLLLSVDTEPTVTNNNTDFPPLPNGKKINIDTLFKPKEMVEKKEPETQEPETQKTGVLEKPKLNHNDYLYDRDDWNNMTEIDKILNQEVKTIDENIEILEDELHDEMLQDIINRYYYDGFDDIEENNLIMTQHEYATMLLNENLYLKQQMYNMYCYYNGLIMFHLYPNQSKLNDEGDTQTQPLKNVIPEETNE